MMALVNTLLLKFHEQKIKLTPGDTEVATECMLIHFQEDLPLCSCLENRVPGG